jgi:hypothetical protein
MNFQRILRKLTYFMELLKLEGTNSMSCHYCATKLTVPFKNELSLLCNEIKCLI